MNRIRVVEEGATTATDINLDEYSALYEEPGRHRYGAYHWSDTCRFGRWDCIAALDADLEAGHVYVVTFRWTSIARGKKATFGRLELLLRDAVRDGSVQQALVDLTRVEVIPGAPWSGSPREVRSAMVSSHILDRLRQDTEDARVSGPGARR